MSEDVCLSGGAQGADVAWGAVAALHGHRVVHFTFEGHGHKSSAPRNTLQYLHDDDLAIADVHCQKANQTLNRRWPISSRYVGNLLRRNFYQVVSTDAVYAISTFDKGMVSGGTAWAVQFFLDRFEKAEYLPCYVFDQVKGLWTQWDGGGFLEIEIPPRPSGLWTGIGTRDLNDLGKHAITSIW